MRLSELIKAASSVAEDPEIEFLVYRWSDDLEDKDYFKADVDHITGDSKLLVFLD